MNTECTGANCEASSFLTATEFNQTCYCKTLDPDALAQALLADNVNQDLLTTHPQLFSPIASFITRQDLNNIRDSIAAIERVIALPEYQQRVMAQAHPHGGLERFRQILHQPLGSL